MSKAIKLFDPHFTHKEVLELTGIPDRTLLVWKQRGVIRLFLDEFTENRGLRLFAPIDVMLVGVLYAIVRSTHVKPSEYAGAVRIILSERPNKLLSNTYYSDYLQMGVDEARETIKLEMADPMFLGIHTIDGSAESACIRQSKISEFYDKSSWNNLSMARAPHVMIPLDHLLIRIRDEMKKLYEVEIK